MILTMIYRHKNRHEVRSIPQKHKIRSMQNYEAIEMGSVQ